MHVITLSEATHRSDGQLLQPGAYIAEDANIAEISVAAPRLSFSVEEFRRWLDRQTFSLWPRLDDESRSLLIIAPGGLGDCMLLTPVLRALRTQRPSLRIGVSVRPQSRCVFDGMSLIDQFEDYPLPASVLRAYDVMIPLEGCNEVGPESRERHAITNKAVRIGVDVPEMKVEYALTDEERNEALTKYPRRSAPRVAIQLAASAFNRCYPHAKLGQVMAKLYERGWEIFLMGTPGSTATRPVPKQYADRVFDMPAAGLSFRQSVAVLSTCDEVVAPDSALMHAAGALGIPCVALFGPIHWKTRTPQYPSVRAIQGTGGCDMAPCFHHQIAGFFWPRGGPCEKTGMCEPLANITPERIIAEVDKGRRPIS